MIMEQITPRGVMINLRSDRSHINYECNDGMDNDPESLGEGHSSHSQNIRQKWIQKMKGHGKLTYELPSTNILDTVTLEHQHTHPTMENIMHIHTYAYFSFIFIISFFFSFFSFSFFFFYIYTKAHTLNINKWTPKMIPIMNRHTPKC